ncbi:MAG: VOC family protein [bacterium]|nr:VOC family protein [bacterium]MXZ30685.1 VOC family protein [Acidimicrobiia bacterium]MYB25219.1 VOC family protein [Acidimicrobiia bacterium]MYE66784.1 VOC family protein [Acidimicrobiia bacterium]MYJ14492.1 VOC family protein [Acidimicrobiia bacterium]
MVDLTAPFHMGVVVSDLAEAMEFYSAGAGLTWHSPQSLDVDLLVEGRTVKTNVRFTYSVTGPVQVELVTGPVGSVWDPRSDAGTYHMGYWTADLRGDLATLTAAGWTVRFSGTGPDGGPAGFAYLIGPDRQQIELVDVIVKAAFANWYAGGDFAV